MAQFGMFAYELLDSHGNPISGASVEVRTQGAFVTSSQSGPTYTVNDPGGIVAATSTCVANTTTAPARACTAATATTVTFGILGLGSLVNNDRISVSSPLPTLYADAQGAETKTNPLTTDASGRCFAWLPIQPVDVKISATGHGTKLETDIIPGGQEYVVSNLFGAGGVTVYRRGTTRTLTAGRMMTLENPIGTNIVWEVDYAGNETIDGNMAVGGNLAVTGNNTVTGNETITGTLGVSGATTVAAVTASGLVTANAGITSAAPFTYSGATGSFSLTAGSIETADLAANCTMVTAQGLGTADLAPVAGPAGYASGNYVDVTGATVTITPFSSASEIVITGVIHTENNGGAYGGYAAIRNGSGTILSESGITDGTGTAGLTTTTTVSHRVTGLTGAQTFKLSQQCVVGTAYDVNDSTHAAKLRISRIIVQEFKK